MNLLPLSKSRWGVFSRCPYYCSMVYEQKLRPPRNKLGSIGVLLHQLRQNVAQGRTTMEDALSMVESQEDKDALVSSIAMDDHTPTGRTIFWEWDLRINGKAKPVKSRGILRGIIDRAVWYDDKIVLDDVKFGKWHYDDEFERRAYALLVLPHIDSKMPVEFERVWPKLGFRDYWRYERTGSFFQVIEQCNGQETTVDLWDWLQRCVLAAANAEPRPTPGSHCENWFGAPCYFVKYCPITRELPVPISPSVSVIKEDIHQLLNSENITALSPNLVSSALSGALQLQGMVTAITNKAKDWAKSNGPIQIGSTSYGWKDRINRGVDKEFVLRLFHDNNIPIEDQAKAINISYTSLAKLPKTHTDTKRIAIEMGTWEDGVTSVFGASYEH